MEEKTKLIIVVIINVLFLVGMILFVVFNLKEVVFVLFIVFTVLDCSKNVLSQFHKYLVWQRDRKLERVLNGE